MERLNPAELNPANYSTVDPQAKRRASCRTKYPSEAREQIAFIKWTQLPDVRYEYPEFKLFFHIPNGGDRDKKGANILKKMGVKKGVPDLFLPCPRGEYNGLFIEMKKQEGGVVSKEQKWWHRRLREMGYYVLVCEGAKKCAEQTLAYMMLDDSDEEIRQVGVRYCGM